MCIRDRYGRLRGQADQARAAVRVAGSEGAKRRRPVPLASPLTIADLRKQGRLLSTIYTADVRVRRGGARSARSAGSWARALPGPSPGAR
eukprot:8039187-Alexandrium_andersonii.AAC.1